jgi:mediator of RNA polymerase II transcription subunit 18
MAQQAHSYDVALVGGFFARDLRAVLTRCALHAESVTPFRAREVTLLPLDAAAQRDASIEPIKLRARREVRIDGNETGEAARAHWGPTMQDDGWILYSYLKPESDRVYPDVTVRPWAVTEIAGDGLAFASALGYV